MSAKTKWFICGKCGFKNHPRLTAVSQYRPSSKQPGFFELVEGDTLCEQCGTSSSDNLSQDYDPNA